MKRPSTTIASATGETLTDDQRFAVDVKPDEVIDALIARRGRPRTAGDRYIAAKLTKLRQRVGRR